MAGVLFIPRLSRDIDGSVRFRKKKTLVQLIDVELYRNNLSVISYSVFMNISLAENFCIWLY